MFVVINIRITILLERLRNLVVKQLCRLLVSGWTISPMSDVKIV